MGILDIIANPQQLKVPDPSAGYGDMLQNALAMDKLGESRRTRRDLEETNELAKRFYGPKGLDLGAYRQALAQGGKAHLIPGIEENEAKRVKLESEASENQANVRNQDAAALKSRTEALVKYHDYKRQAAEGITDVKQFAPRAAQIYKSQMAYDLFGGEQQAREAYNNDMAEADAAAKSGKFGEWLNSYKLGAEKALEQTYQLVGEKDKQTLVGVNKYGAPTPEVAATYGPKPESSTTINNITGGNKYRDKFEELQATSDFEGQQQAKEAGVILDSIKDAHGLVDRAYTGMGAGVKQVLNQGANMLGVGDAAGDDARVATQQLNSYLATAMLKNIAALRNEGVKLGSVTEKEFAELQKTTPTGSSDPKTIHAWLDKMDASMRRAIEEHKAQLNRAGTAPSTGRTITNMGIKPVAIDGAKGSTKAIMGQNGSPVPPKAIDILRAQPGTRALFEKRFGKAAADQILGGGTQPGARPFQQ